MLGFTWRFPGLAIFAIQGLLFRAKLRNGLHRPIEHPPKRGTAYLAVLPPRGRLEVAVEFGRMRLLVYRSCITRIAQCLFVDFVVFVAVQLRSLLKCPFIIRDGGWDSLNARKPASP